MGMKYLRHRNPITTMANIMKAVPANNEQPTHSEPSHIPVSGTWYFDDFDSFAAPLDNWFHRATTSESTMTSSKELDRLERSLHQHLKAYQSHRCASQSMVDERERRIVFLEKLLNAIQNKRRESLVIWHKSEVEEYRTRKGKELDRSLNRQAVLIEQGQLLTDPTDTPQPTPAEEFIAMIPSDAMYNPAREFLRNRRKIDGCITTCERKFPQGVMIAVVKLLYDGNDSLVCAAKHFIRSSGKPFKNTELRKVPVTAKHRARAKEIVLGKESR